MRRGRCRRRFIKEQSMTIQAINVRNQFKGKVKAIIEGSVVSEVDVEPRPVSSLRSSPPAP
jgi:hypothetical protein